MTIEPVLHKLVSMLEDAGIAIPDDQRNKDDHIEVFNVNPAIVCEVFKRFAHIPFDCSFTNQNELDPSRCMNWEDGCLLFECFLSHCPPESETLYLEFRRPFFLTVLFNGNVEPLIYQDIITCRLQFEPNDVLRQLEAEVVMAWSQRDKVDEFFQNVETLEAYRVPVEKYKAQRLHLFHSD